MISFKNDYSEGAHPEVLQALVEYNELQEDGYGLDTHSQNAAMTIRELVADPQAEVHFLSGGTQTNLIAISSFLRPHEACIAARTGHIATHECGAVEATGHKLLTVTTEDGKLTPELIAPVLQEHHFEHMVKPRMVYISEPTELGTLYTQQELLLLSDFCQQKELYLYADGARLGAALVCEEAALSWQEIYTLTDAFFIGGTKNGALLGEALVVRNPLLQKDLRYLIKQKGALLAKGRILGVQFEALLKDDLYLELARQANERAQRMAEALAETGAAFLISSPTNQIFPVLPNEIIEELSRRFDFYVWAKVSASHSAVRLVTSWATRPEAVENFIAELKRLTRRQEGA